MKQFIVIALLVVILFFSGCAKKADIREHPDTGLQEAESQQPEQNVETAANDSAEETTAPGTEPKRIPCSRNFSPTLSSGPYYEGPLFDAHFHMPQLVDFSKLMGERYESHSANPVTDPVLHKDVGLEKILCAFEKENVRGAIGFTIGAEEALEETLSAAESANKETEGKIKLFLMPSNFEAARLDEIQKNNPDLFKGYGETAFYVIEQKGENPDDQRFLDIYEVAGRHGLIVMIHPDGRQESSIENALQKNPNVKFIFHGPEIEDSIPGIIERHPNAYYSIDAILTRVPPSPGGVLYTTNSKENFISEFTQNYDIMMDRAVDEWKAKIEQHPDRYMWGTDRAHKWTYDEEVSVLLEEFSRDFIAELDPSAQEKFAYKNAEKLLQE